VSASKILPVVLIIIVLGGVGGYFYSQQEISKAATIVINSLEPIDAYIEDFSLFPPSIKFILVCSVSNPTNYDLDLTIDAELYSDDIYITEFKIENERIPADSSSSIEILLPFGSNLLENPDFSESSAPLMSGEIIVNSKVLFYPITVSKTFNDLSIVGSLEDQISGVTDTSTDGGESTTDTSTDDTPGEAYYIDDFFVWSQDEEITTVFGFYDEQYNPTTSDGFVEIRVFDEASTEVYFDSFSVDADDFDFYDDYWGYENLGYWWTFPYSVMDEGIGYGNVEFEFYTQDRSEFWSQTFTEIEIPQLDVSEYIQIADDYGYYSYAYYVTGQITNIGDVNVGDIEIQVRYFDKDDNLIGLADWAMDQTWANILEPDQLHYFEVYKDVDPFRYEISVNGNPTYETPYTEFEFSNLYQLIDDGDITITGELTNLGTKRESIQISAVFFDQNDLIIGIESIYLFLMVTRRL